MNQNQQWSATVGSAINRLLQIAGMAGQPASSSGSAYNAPDVTHAALSFMPRDVFVPGPSSGVIPPNQAILPVPAILVGANTARRYLLLQNISSQDVWIGFDQTPYSTQTGYRANGAYILRANSEKEFLSAPLNQLQAYSPSQQGALVVVIEGVF